MVKIETAETKHDHRLDDMLFVSPRLKCNEVIQEIKEIYSTKPSIYSPKIAKEMTLFCWDGKCKHKKSCADRDCTICFENVFPMHAEDIKKIKKMTRYLFISKKEMVTLKWFIIINHITL